MRTALIAGAALLVGVALGCFSSLRTIRVLRRRVRELRAGRDGPQTETMKRVLWACVLNGFAWVWCSYVLAALDKPQIAESLYAGKSAIENLSKNNHWPDKAATDSGSESEEPPDGG